jgi:hypothetical protein
MRMVMSLLNSDTMNHSGEGQGRSDLGRVTSNTVVDGDFQEYSRQEQIS